MVERIAPKQREQHSAPFIEYITRFHLIKLTVTDFLFISNLCGNKTQ